MHIGYARVSTTDQDLTIQREALMAAGCERIFEEKASGTSRDQRPELRHAIDYLREGDTLVVTRIDRLARSVLDLHTIVKEITDKGANLAATGQPVDTGSASGKAFLGMLSVFAEFETNLRLERQMEGIAKAKAMGKYRGRKPKVITRANVDAMKAQGMKMSAIAKELRCGRATLYRALSLNGRATKISKMSGR